MIRISVYHWLPIADNMLQEIEKRLRALPSNLVSDVEVERDAVSYHTVFKFSRDFRSHAVFPMPGKISQRGYCQHVLNVAPIPGLPMNALLNDLVPELRRSVADLLFAVAPDSVRNKLDVLHVGITPFQQFQSTTLDSPMDQAARAFLMDSQITAIILDETHYDCIRAGFLIPAVQLEVLPQHAQSAAVLNANGDCVLFYSSVFHPDEWAMHDSVIYKYCALVLYVRMLHYTLSLLKQTRDHLIPLRRRLALALQGNISEYFDSLTQIKRYLTYVNIKLPAIQKVIHHLDAVRQSQTFAAKIDTFDEPAKVFAYPAIRSIEDSTWQPHHLISKIDEEAERVGSLFDEDMEEMQIISSELSQVLEGSLLSEQVQVSARSLDAAQSMLEIERSAKNLANAHKTMSILLMATLGMLVANSFGIGISGMLGVGLGLFATGYLVTAFALQRHSSYYRLVIPVRAALSPEALANWVSSHHLIRNKTNGNQITCTWREPISVRVLESSPKTGLRKALTHKGYFTHTFEITVDFQRRGFLNSITLETEHLTALFDARDLVEAVFKSLQIGECLNDTEAGETSLYAMALTELEIPLEGNLPALNKLLTLPSAQVSQIITTGASTQTDSSLSKLDLALIQDLNAQPRAYKDWLLETLNNPARTDLLTLAGLYNVRQKLMLIEHLEEEHVKRA